MKLPSHIDIFHLKREIEPTEMTALQAVLDVDEARKRLEAEAEMLIEMDMADSERLITVYERLDQMDASRGGPSHACFFEKREGDPRG